jgi:hypothetical protein
LRPMNLMRSTAISKFVAMATAVVFLNMSFFLTEITMLNLHDDNIKVFERLVKILANTGQEEEGDTEANEEGPEAFVDFSIVSISAYDATVAFVQEHNNPFANIISTQNVCEITTPPPRFS